MKMNWKVRLRNPVFWTSFLAALVTFVYSVLGLFGVVPGIAQEQILQIVSAVLSFLATIGVLIDPTTKGLSDSERAMQYEKPN